MPRHQEERSGFLAKDPYGLPKASAIAAELRQRKDPRQGAVAFIFVGHYLESRQLGAARELLAAIRQLPECRVRAQGYEAIADYFDDLKVANPAALEAATAQDQPLDAYLDLQAAQVFLALNNLESGRRCVERLLQQARLPDYLSCRRLGQACERLGMLELSYRLLTRLRGTSDVVDPEIALFLAKNGRLDQAAETRIPEASAWLALAGNTSPDQSPRIDVVIPVYRDRRITLHCIHSVLASRNRIAYELVVVDDCSPEPELSRDLARLAELGLITLLVNETNQGFVRSVNRGMALHPDRDVLLLNSDTEVNNDWLDRIHAAAWSRPDVGTVTPLSNNATICSYPSIGENNMALEVDTAALDRLAARVNAGRSIDIPTAVGFCMYIRRDCLDQVGAFDAETFGLGYGEENDFCMRAMHQGWRHLLLGDTYVRHFGSVSFGASRNERAMHAMRILESRYPEYPRLVRGHIAANPAQPLRTAIDVARVTARLGSRPAILFVGHALGGGTEKHLQEMQAMAAGQGYATLTLRPSFPHNGKLWVEADGVLHTCNLPQFDGTTADGLATLGDWLKPLGIRHIHVHNLVGYPIPTIRWLAGLGSVLGCDYDYTGHDYSPLCPRITLIDNRGRFCDVATPDKCRQCLASESEMPVDIVSWRHAFASLLQQARRVFVPSRDVGERLGRHIPNLSLSFRPHSFDPLPQEGSASIGRSPTAPEDGAIRIAVLGAIHRAKGAGVLLACARDAEARGLPLRFVVVGTVDIPAHEIPGNMVVTGRYRESDVDGLLAEHGCTLAFFPAIWPETYSYTLSIALRNRLRPIAFDLGAIAERIRDCGFGELLALDLAAKPQLINAALEAAGRRSTETSFDPRMLEVRWDFPRYYELGDYPENKPRQAGALLWVLEEIASHASSAKSIPKAPIDAAGPCPPFLALVDGTEDFLGRPFEWHRRQALDAGLSGLIFRLSPDTPPSLLQALRSDDEGGLLFGVAVSEAFTASENAFQLLTELFADPRYLHVQGQPVLFVAPSPEGRGAAGLSNLARLVHLNPDAAPAGNCSPPEAVLWHWPGKTASGTQPAGKSTPITGVALPTAGERQPLDPQAYARALYLAGAQARQSAGCVVIEDWHRLLADSGAARAYVPALSDLTRAVIRAHTPNRSPLAHSDLGVCQPLRKILPPGILAPLTEPDVRLMDQATTGAPALRIVVVDDGARPLDALLDTLISAADQQLACPISLISSRTDRSMALPVDEQEHAPAPWDSLLACLARWQEDWLVVLEPGDCIVPQATLALRWRLARKPEAAALYTDDVVGDRAVFKPDTNLTLLRSQDYIDGLLAVRRQALATMGSFPDPVAAGYDLALGLIDRFGEAAMLHLPQALRWRRAPARPEESAAAQKLAALARHLGRRDLPAQVFPGVLPGLHGIRYEARETPLVSIIIPTRDQAQALQRCVETLIGSTRYPRFEILVVDNGSTDPVARNFLQGLGHIAPDRIRVIAYPGRFNFAAINNLAADTARGDYLLLLNDDTAALHPDWLDQLMACAHQPDVGVVGARLLFPDGRIQHAGVILGLGGCLDYPYNGMSLDAPGKDNRLQSEQELSAVSASCMLVRKSLYRELGGLDAEGFPISFGDFDFCLRAKEKGYRVVWTPRATLLHETALSLKRALADQGLAQQEQARFERERALFVRRWVKRLANDPAYNPNLSLAKPYFEVQANAELAPDPAAPSGLPAIFGLPADDGGSAQYRVIQPLEEAHRTLAIRGRMAGGYPQPLELERLGIDTLFSQRQVDDNHLAALRHLRSQLPVRIVMDFDDLLTHIPEHNVHRRNAWKDMGRRLEELGRLSDCVTVSTAPLQEAMGAYHGDVRLVPNGLSSSWFSLKSRRNVSDRLRVGWAGGISHAGDLAIVREIMLALADDVEWVFLGMCLRDMFPCLTEFHPGVPYRQYPEKLASLNLDLAIAPLEINRFNECKSNLRLLEYGALGIPVVATDAVPYRCGLPVTLVKNRPVDWVRAIRERIGERTALDREGENLRQAVQAEWSLDKQLPAWVAAWTGS